MSDDTTTAPSDGKDPVEATVASIKEAMPSALLLSQLVGPAPAPGSPAAYVPPTYASRTESRQLIHDKALKDIARLRFAFPTEKYRDLKTYVNHPARTMGVEMENGLVAYPDIVVVQHPENNCRIVAEVETNETVNEAVARWEWLPYAELAPLYLYVPVGKGDDAQNLCRQLEIPVVGIRTWRYIAGYEEPEINDHYTVPSGPEDMLPKFLRPS
ncbi:MAG TPA: hypothetical protein VMT90_03245 [Dehalococcoidia bacterium]|jgi:hypothetical protein|nr:hypothetical protein [Dehalococcoidia bacterium]